MMGMTIDEIILKETKSAQEFQEVIDTHMVSEDMTLEEMYCDDTEVIEEQLKRCKELSDYHNTIANTMRKYQRVQEIIKSEMSYDSPNMNPNNLSGLLRALEIFREVENGDDD